MGKVQGWFYIPADNRQHWFNPNGKGRRASCNCWTIFHYGMYSISDPDQMPKCSKCQQFAERERGSRYA